MMSKFLNLNNKEDFNAWEKTIEKPCADKLERCPYEQDFKQSKSCSHYEQVNEGEECSFVWITDSKCYCELQLKEEDDE
jgi:hypothetical protein